MNFIGSDVREHIFTVRQITEDWFSPSERIIPKGFITIVIIEWWPVDHVDMDIQHWVAFNSRFSWSRCSVVCKMLALACSRSDLRELPSVSSSLFFSCSWWFSVRIPSISCWSCWRRASVCSRAMSCCVLSATAIPPGSFCLAQVALSFSSSPCCCASWLWRLSTRACNGASSPECFICKFESPGFRLDRSPSLEFPAPSVVVSSRSGRFSDARDEAAHRCKRMLTEPSPAVPGTSRSILRSSVRTLFCRRLKKSRENSGLEIEFRALINAALDKQWKILFWTS